MDNKKTKRIIKKATFGFLVNIVDYVFINLGILGELFTIPPTGYTMSNVQKVLFDTGLRVRHCQTKRAIYRAKSHQWIKKDLRLTKKGKKRLNELLPVFSPSQKWEGSWYLVIFDVPEKLRFKRDILRKNLKELRFGRLQQSVWISPVNHLLILDKLIFRYQLEPYVIFSQTHKIGREEARELAQRVWKLQELNQEYKEFISDWKKTKEKKEKIFLIMKYFQILSQDPQLPKELLPKDWMGIKSYELVKGLRISKLLIKY